MKFPDDLLRGDILLYSAPDLVDRVIEWKEGDNVLPVGHVEVYAGGGKAWASRNGIGVGLYPFRPDGLTVVRRPIYDFDPAGKVDEWFQGINGTPYGWDDIKANAGISVKNPSGMDCSHFAALLEETAACPQFDIYFPKGEITPRDFKISKESTQFYPSHN